MTSIEPEVIEAAKRVGAATDLPARALLAVALVETNAVAFAHVDGRREPLIRFEGHYFDRRLDGASRERARAAGLSDPAAGAVRNPASQAARWALLGRAAAIDAEAAYASASWGLGQVMGAHWQRLGFRDARDLAAHARSGAGGQLDLCARFLLAEDLAGLLRAADFAGFARRYNGPNYRTNRYDEKIAAAWSRAADFLDAPPAAPATLARGSRGQAVFDLQEALAEAGHDLGVDGVFGSGTEAALRDYQKRRGLPETGRGDAATLAALGVVQDRNGICGTG
jgi:hypothetical protein